MFKAICSKCPECGSTELEMRTTKAVDTYIPIRGLHHGSMLFVLDKERAHYVESEQETIAIQCPVCKLIQFCGSEEECAEYYKDKLGNDAVLWEDAGYILSRQVLLKYDGDKKDYVPLEISCCYHENKPVFIKENGTIEYCDTGGRDAKV